MIRVPSRERGLTGDVVTPLARGGHGFFEILLQEDFVLVFLIRLPDHSRRLWIVLVICLSNHAWGTMVFRRITPSMCEF